MPLLSFHQLVSQFADLSEIKDQWKVVRHLDRRSDAPDLLQLFYTDPAAFDFYQAEQKSDIFNGCKGFFAFLGLPQRRALFVGAYRVLSKRCREPFKAEEIPSSIRDFLMGRLAARAAESVFWYGLERDMRFESMEMRVVVDWGDGALAWHQWKTDKEVVELRNRGELHPCSDYRDIDVSLSTLAHLFKYESANPSWSQKLSAVGGIYLLTDTKNQKLYVGQAGGEGGFWSRWRAYADGNTGNIKLDPAFAGGEIDRTQARLSVLEVVPRGPQSGEQLNKLEERWKQRLCSRSDYNAN